MSTTASLNLMFLSPVVVAVCPWKTEHILIKKVPVLVVVVVVVYAKNRARIDEKLTAAVQR